nr:helix-turn-helix domain-containing protein [Butyricimonas synergistica]
MLFRTPKTLSNLFSEYGFPSPLQVIHGRVEAETKRLLLYTSKSAKEIGSILGFEDIAAFSRFFKKMTGKAFPSTGKRKNRNNRQLIQKNCHSLVDCNRLVAKH